MHQRFFSIEEANGLLPVLRPILGELKREWAFMQLINNEIRKAHAVSDRSGGSVFGPRYIESAEQVVHYLHTVQEMGVLVKDPSIGLCDFPHQRESRVVHLCWKLGEDEIGWWHDIDAGFAEREPLENLDD
jgi:hypothetical protein